MEIYVNQKAIGAGRRRRGFSPAQISGLVLWLRADVGLYEDAAKAVPATDDGDAIYTWADQSGNGNDAVQATLANRPTLKLAIQNGKPVVRFDGVNDYLSISSNILGVGDQPCSVIIVANFSSVADAAWFATGQQPQANLGNYYFLSLSGAMYFANISNDRSTADGTLSTGVWYLLNVQVSVGAISSSNPVFYRNGQAVASSQGTGASTPNLIAGATVVGATTQIGEYLAGDIAELLIYNSALSTANRQLVENHLNAKYAVY